MDKYYKRFLINRAYRKITGHNLNEKRDRDGNIVPIERYNLKLNYNPNKKNK